MIIYKHIRIGKCEIIGRASIAFHKTLIREYVNSERKVLNKLYFRFYKNERNESQES